MFKKLIQRYKASEFLVNVNKLTSGTAIAQFIAIGTAPILYRIYDKEYYGSLSLYMAITGVVGVFSTLQYMQTILLEKEDESAINAMWLNRILNTVFSLFTFLLLIVLFPFIIEWVNNSVLNKWLWFIPLSIFFAGQNEIYKVWANRKKEYNLLTFNSIFMALLTPIISIGLGLVIKNETGLFVGLIVGQSLPALILLIGLRRKYSLGLEYVTMKNIKTLAIAHRRFPIFSLPGEFISRLGSNLPIFMLTTFSGLASVSEYSLANRILGLPSQFIGGAISTVFQQKATEDFHKYGNYKTIFLKILKLLVLLMIVPLILFTCFGEQLFTLVFGLQWSNAGRIAAILAPVFALRLINSPLSYGFYIHKLQVMDFIFAIVFIVGTYFTMLLLFNKGFDYIKAITGYSILVSIIYVFLILINYKLSNKK